MVNFMSPLNWLILIPIALLALTILFPAQHYVALLQRASFQRDQFMELVKADVEFSNDLVKRNRRVSILLYGILLLVSIVAVIPSLLIFDNLFLVVILSFSILIIAPVISYHRMTKEKKFQLLSSSGIHDSRAIRWNVALGIVSIIAMYLLVLLIFGFWFLCSLLASQLIGLSQADVMRNLWVVLPISLVSAPRCFGIPRLLVISSFLTQPIERIIEKRKDA